jgi:LemA protein
MGYSQPKVASTTIDEAGSSGVGAFTMWIWIVVAVLIVLVGIWAVVSYNGFVRLRNIVEESWRQIDVELHRRYDLIPNLVETVKGYAAHERQTFETVTQARAAAVSPGSTPGEQAVQENMLTSALRQLLAVAEAYPDLKANQNFLELQGQLTQTEDRIAAGRRFYNANVRNYNTKVETFPPNILARMFNFTKREYFEAEDPTVRSAPEVRF